jgi:hypothetical protein
MRGWLGFGPQPVEHGSLYRIVCAYLAQIMCCLHGWFVRHPLRILCPLSTAQESSMNLTAFGLASLIGMAATAPVAAAEPAHPTIRHMAGAPVATSLDAAKTAVLVIDFQNEYFDAKAAPGFAGGRMVIPDGVAALRQAKRVVEFADAHGIRVIHVQHVLPAGAPLFAQGSVNAAFHRDLQPRAGRDRGAEGQRQRVRWRSAAVLDRC